MEESRDCIRRTILTDPDASGACGRQFFFAILVADDPAGKVIGAVGVSALRPVPTLEFSTHPSTWNRGLATEAVRAVVDAWWKLPRISVDSDVPASSEKLFAWCEFGNAAGMKVLMKNGFGGYGDILASGNELALFELGKPQG